MATVIGTVAATDPDIAGTNTDANPDTATADSLTYSLSGTTAAPTDYQSFDIGTITNGGQLKLKTGTTLDYETKSTYTVKVTASDGSTDTASIDITINVTNVNEPPVFPADTTTSFNISESAAGGTVIGTVAATDPDIAGTNTDANPDTATADSLSYSLGGTTAAPNDYQSFTIENTTNGGQLKLKTGTTLDYDTKSAYTVKVTASDGSTNTASIDITINVVETVSVSITAASAVTEKPQNSAFDVTITFSETVTGFAASDISLTTTLTEGTGSATVSNLTGSGTTYTATITPPANVEGTVKISVPAGAAVDSNSQGNAASSEFSVDIDTKSPGVAITNVPTTTQNGVFDVTITFTEDVTGFTASDITLGGTATATASVASVNNAEYTATITPTTNGSVSIQVPADVAKDGANNNNTASGTHTVTVSLAGPSVAITNVPTTSQNSAFVVTITFSEAVTGFTASDITLTTTLSTGTGNATVTSLALVTGSDTQYTTTITPPANVEGTVKISVLAAAAVNSTNQGNTASSEFTVDIDTKAPGVAITNVPTTTQNSAFTVTITFGEDVTGFAASDITLGGTATASVTSLTGSGTTYIATITPTTNGSVSIQVPADAAKDAAGNGNTQSQSHAVTFTTEISLVATTLDIVSGDDQFGRTNQWLSKSLVVLVKDQIGDLLPGVTVEFSTPFNPDTGRSFGAVSPTTNVTDADGQASTRFRLGSTAGTYTVKASVDGIAKKVTFTANAIGTINREYNSLGKITSDPINIHYGDSVDIIVSVSPIPDEKTSAAQYVDFYLGSFAESGVFNTEHTGLSFDDTFKVKVPGSNNLYTYQTNSNGEATARLDVASDAEIPDLEPNVDGKSFRVMVAFLVENVNGTRFLSDGTSEGISPAPISFTVRVTEPETSEGQAVEDNSEESQPLQANVVEENSGEVQGGQPQTVVSEVKTVEVDTDAPGASVSVPSGVQTGEFDATITFTEAVSDFAHGDLSIGGTANASITAWLSHPDNTTYTALITPTTSGEVTLQVPADVAIDAANNSNTASETHTITVEIPAPIPDPATWMPDANLRTVVREALKLTDSQTLTQAKMAELTTLRAAKK